MGTLNAQQRDEAEAQIDAFIKKNLEEAPPLTPAQIAFVRSVLAGASK